MSAGPQIIPTQNNSEQGELLGQCGECFGIALQKCVWRGEYVGGKTDSHFFDSFPLIQALPDRGPLSRKKLPSSTNVQYVYPDSSCQYMLVLLLPL